MSILDIIKQLKNNPHAPGIIQLSVSKGEQLQTESFDNSFIYNNLVSVSSSLQKELIRYNEPVEEWPIHQLHGRSVIAVCIDSGKSGILLPILILSILASGYIMLPLDPNDPIQRTIGILERLQKDSTLLVVEGEPRLSLHPISKSNFKIVSLDSLVKPPTNVTLKLPAIHPKSISHIYMTSGSSGTPKGCILSHENLSSYLSSKLQTLSPSSRVLVASPFIFDPFLGDTLSSWLAGCPIIIGSTQDLVWSRLDECLKAVKVTHITTTPSVWNRVHEVHQDLIVALGGESMPAHLHTQNVQLYNTYGVTECCVYQDLHRVTNDVKEIGSGFSSSPIHVFGNGQQTDDFTNMQILSPEKDFIGEIVISGKQVGLGYWFEKTLTLSKFVKHPILGKCFRTGDLVQSKDGHWSLLGRSDSQVKIREKRVDLLEIESWLLSNFPGILKEVAVTYNSSLIAWCRGEAVASRLISKKAEEYFPNWMVPRISFSEFYYTTTGKVDRKKMATRQLLEESWQECGGWSNEILRASAKLSIPPWRDFFQTGGDSFTALRLCKRLAETYKTNPGTFGEHLEEFSPLELMKRSQLFEYATYLHHAIGPLDDSPCGDGATYQEEVDVGQVIQANAKHTFQYLLNNDMMNGYPLHLACKAGNVEFVTQLLPRFSLNARHEGLLPLHASVNGPIELINLLLTQMTKTVPVELVLKSVDENAQTTLHHAARFGVKDSIMQFWIDLFIGNSLNGKKRKPISLDVKDKFGRTALHWAVLHGHATLVSLLLSHGSSTSIVDSEGETPLDMAERRARCGAQERMGNRASVWGDIATRLGGSGATKNVKKFLHT
jgi:acyl-CoA synthetase (AMP-forming)/AMP-acid ligase II